MVWQWVAVAATVTVAILYLVRQTWRTWGRRGSGCGTCSCASKTAESATAGSATFIPATELTIRSRPR